MSITGNVTFNDDTQNFGLIDGTAVFNDNSQNDGIVEGDATFTESSENNGTVTGDSSFEDSSKNQGSVEGDANFYDIATNKGMVDGTGTFNNNSVNDGVVNNIDLKDEASATQSSKFFGVRGTQIYYPYQKSNGLFYVINKNCMEEIAGYTLMGVYDQGVLKLTPKQITPIKFYESDFDETWDQHTSKNPEKFMKAINFYEKVYNFLSGELPPAPYDGSVLDVHYGTRDEWALLLTRMAYFESSYNSNCVTDNESYGIFQMGLGQNAVYQFSAVKVNGTTTYPPFTVNQMKDDNLQLALAWKALNQNLGVVSYEKTGTIYGTPSFFKGKGVRLLHAWGAPTSNKIMRELSASPKFYSYENGNKNPPIEAHGCYTNGFYRYGIRDYRSVFKPTAAKDTDDAIIQNAVNHDNI